MWEAFFKEHYPEVAARMQWDVSAVALERVQSLVFEGKSFFHLTVVPNLLEAFGKNQDPVSMDLRMAFFFEKLSCQQNGVQFSNDCFIGKRFLLKEKDGYEYFYRICEEQGVGLILLLVQYGQVHPYDRGTPSPLMEHEFHVTLGLEFMVMAMQKPQIVWGLEPSRIIASRGSMAQAGFEQETYSSFPCIEYYPDERTVAVMPLGESLAWETDERRRMVREHNVGFMTAMV